MLVVVVVRLRLFPAAAQGPFLGFEPYVGSKTHYRLINHKWADAYTTNPYLQLEKNATLVVSRTGWQEFLTVRRLHLPRKGHHSAPPRPVSPPASLVLNQPRAKEGG